MQDTADDFTEIWVPRDEDAPAEDMSYNDYDMEDIYNYVNVTTEDQGQLFTMEPTRVEFTRDALETSYELAERVSRAVIAFENKTRSWEDVERELISLCYSIWNHVPLAKTYKSMYDTLGL